MRKQLWGRVWGWLRRMRMMRFGIGWRAELGVAILANLDRIEVVEVLAEEFAGASAAERRALRFLSRSVPIVVHGTSLGLASTEAVDRKKLDAVARVIGWIEPELWSEHLAFVRGGGIEVGHLAAPPRNRQTLEGLRSNLDAVRSVVGTLPALENIASLVEPPLSEWSEGEWLERVAGDCGANLLLDLHNLHANATNHRFDAHDVLRRIDHGRVSLIHLAGGKRIEGGRILDDHRHAVPDAVYSLLETIDSDASVILERDGNYPPYEEMLAELDRARASVRRRAA